MDDKEVLTSCLLFAVFVLCAWWHVHENTRLKRELESKTDPNTAKWLLHFAWSRTAQLLVSLAATIVIIMMYGWQLGETHNDNGKLLQTLAQKEIMLQQQTEAIRKAAVSANNAAEQLTAIANAATQPAEQAATQTQPPAEPAATEAPPETPPEAPVEENTPPAPEPAAAATPEEPAAPVQEIVANTGNTVEDVYNPERRLSDDQSSMDDIKKRYEDILVIYMFLQKCGKVQPSDYNTITYALSQEMAAVNAPQKLQSDILTSAEGSYKEIYSKSTCDGEGIAALDTQYNDYIKVLATSFPAQ